MKLILQVLIAASLLVFLGFQISRGIQTTHLKVTPVCPVKAITMVNGKAIINATKCIGCRRCVDGVLVLPGVPTSPVVPASITPPAVAVAQTPDPPHPETKPLSQVASKPAKPKTDTVTVVTTPPKQAHRVDPAICIGCGLCVSICPVNAITMVSGKAIIDKDKCINCGICKNGNQQEYAGCPVGAISAP